MWIPWNWALVIAAGLAMAGFALARFDDRRLSRFAPFISECSLVFVLYALWNGVGRLAVMRIDGAIDRAEWLWRAEVWLPVPTVVQVQDWVLPHPWLVQALNGYYAAAHVPGMVVVLIWLFWRHRDQYSWVRNTLALLTALGVAVHLVPVAPPRFLPHHGVVDTPVLYDQSVYSAFGSTVAGQLSALPSLHVGWAVLAAWATWRATSSRWRILGPAHAVLTVIAVVATGNHFWLDGVAAVVLLAPAVAIDRRIVTPAIDRLRQSRSGADDRPTSTGAAPDVDRAESESAASATVVGAVAGDERRRAGVVRRS